MISCQSLAFSVHWTCAIKLTVAVLLYRAENSHVQCCRQTCRPTDELTPSNTHLVWWR